MSKTLLLSGWTQPAEALAHLDNEALIFDYSEHSAPSNIFTDLLAFREAKHVIAWSLGGQLALRAIAVGALRPAHLTLIAAPYCFTGPDGMGEETFALFRESYARDPARTKMRFHALIAKGDADAKRVTASLMHHPEVDDVARWLPWLDMLQQVNLVHENLAHLPPTLIIHGMNDAIVPYAQGKYLARMLPCAQLNSWKNVGHAPHVHDVLRMRNEILAHRTQHGVA